MKSKKRVPYREVEHHLVVNGMRKYREVKTSEVKRGIDALIDQEYIERDENDRTVLLYMA